jgi:hypothetical protein
MGRRGSARAASSFLAQQELRPPRQRIVKHSRDSLKLNGQVNFSGEVKSSGLRERCDRKA